MLIFLAKNGMIWFMKTAPENTIDATLTQAKLSAVMEENAELKRQLQWWKQQYFGRKSERRVVDVPESQGVLQEMFDAPLPPPVSEPSTPVGAHDRKKKRKDSHVTDSGLRFDDAVPVEEVRVLPPELKGSNAHLYEIVSEQVTDRLAQRKGSYVVLRYIHPTYRLKGGPGLVSAPAPANVIEKSLADVSFMAGLLVDKFCFHLPLYRIHQRLQSSGIDVSRQTLTNIAQRSIELLRPIVEAMIQRLPDSPLLAMDETHILAGRQQQPKMHQAYLWPIYTAHQDVIFTYSESRSGKHLKMLDDYGGVLLTDGYEAYANYVKRRGLNTPGKQLLHALCWAHARRTFIKAEDSEPQAVREALDHIRALYAHEEYLREHPCSLEEQLAYRKSHQEPVVDSFFAWCHAQLHRADLTPKMPLTKALKYVLEREQGLRLFLSRTDVPIDTNHLERALRVIPMGRKNWTFCWTELGAKHVAIIQSLLVTCKQHGVDPHTYLVDVLQRVGMHPASAAYDLSPREWKQKFAADPLRSDLDLKPSMTG